MPGDLPKDPQTHQFMLESWHYLMAAVGALCAWLYKIAMTRVSTITTTVFDFPETYVKKDDFKELRKELREERKELREDMGILFEKADETNKIVGEVQVDVGKLEGLHEKGGGK